MNKLLRFGDNIFPIVEKITAQCAPYSHLIIQAWNFILAKTLSGEVFPLIPEMRKETDPDKYHACFTNPAYDPHFSLASLKMGLDLFGKLKTQKKELVFVLLADDKGNNITQSDRNQFFGQGYTAIPNIWRKEIEIQFDEAKWGKKKLRAIPSVLRSTGQKIINDFLLSENALARRHKVVCRSQKEQSNFYQSYKNNLWPNFTSCSLELHHLLSIISWNKENIFPSRKNGNKMAMVSFVADSCQGSASVSAKDVTSRDPDFDVINIVPVFTGSDVFVVDRISKGKSVE